MLRPRGIYLLVDPAVLAEAEWQRVLPAVLRSGLALVQLRVKQCSDSDRVRMARVLLGLCQAADVPLLINDDIDLCARVGAGGVHLGQRDGTVSEARARLGKTAIIGQTCHADLRLVEAAQGAGADYASIGALFSSATKPTAQAADLQCLRRAIALNALPICAIGGINARTITRLPRPGPDLVAVCGGILRAPAPAEAAQHLVRSWRHD